MSVLFPKVLEKLDSLRTILTPDSEDQITLEILHVSKELAETFAIFYQPRFQHVVKPLLRKSSVSKLNRFYKDLYGILGDGFSVHLNLSLSARSNNTDGSTHNGVLTNGHHHHHSNGTTNNINNNALHLKLPSNKTRQQDGDKKQDGSINNGDLKPKEGTMTNNSQNETATADAESDQHLKLSSSSSLGQITFTSKWNKKKITLKPSNALTVTGMSNMRPLVGQLNKKSKSIHKSLTLSSKKKKRIMKRKVFLTLPL